MNTTGLSEIFLTEMKEVLGAEKTQLNYYNNLISKTGNFQLDQLTETYLAETKLRIYRAEEIFYLMDQSPRSSECKLMRDILERLRNMVYHAQDSAGFLFSIQSINYLEISRYATLSEYAKKLDRADIQYLLEESLRSAKLLDRKISSCVKEQLYSTNYIPTATLS